MSLIFCEHSSAHFSPAFKYDNGEYWGQYYIFEGVKIPHGRGSYKSNDGKVKFDGEWREGEPHEGTRFYEDGRNYTGHFKHSMLHGQGKIAYKNGTIIDGEFLHGVPCGIISKTYSNGDIRTGYFNQTWLGQCTFFEKGYNLHPWMEFWEDGQYEAEVEIYKSAIDKYKAIKVEIICKVHSLTATAELWKANAKVRNAFMEPQQMLDQEVATIRHSLDFSDDPFKTYACVARDGNRILASKSLHVRNPFFLLSYGDCGAQFAAPHQNRLSKRAIAHRISMGHEQLYPGQVPWQALLWSNLLIPLTNNSIEGYCGGTIISPFHILTAAHCVKTSHTSIGRDLLESEIVVKVGYNSQPFDPNGQDYEVKRIQVHPEFTILDNEQLINDIALVTLTSRIEITNYVNPICLPEPSTNAKISTEEPLTLSGFGLVYNHNTMKLEKPTFLQGGA